MSQLNAGLTLEDIDLAWNYFIEHDTYYFDLEEESDG